MEEEQERQQNEKTEISLAEIFILNPEIKKGLNPHAAERYFDWLIEVFQEIAQLTTGEKVNVDADLDTYLNDADKAWAKKYKEGILEWLWKCTNLGEGYSRYSPVYDTSVISDMFGLKSLIRKAYEARAEKLEAERRQIEWEQKWHAAWEYLYPLKLFEKAQHYLTDAEQKKWQRALIKATTAYVNGDTNLTSKEASEALVWREEIAKREEEENKRLRAHVLATQYNHDLLSEIKRFKSSLYAQHQHPSVFLNQTSQDFTFDFSHLLRRDEHEEVRSKYNDVESAKFRELMISYPNLADYITINEKAGRWWLWASFHTDYELDGLPSLNFYLRPFVVFESQLILKRHQGYFLEQLFTFPLNAQEKPLGYFYGVISPGQFFDEDTEAGFWWQTIPIPLIEALHQGGPLPKTIEVIACDNASTIYKVRGFKQPVHIPQDVAEWLKTFPTLEALVFFDYMSQNVYDIFSQHLQTTGGSARSTATHHASSKKEQAFSLFGEGEFSSSPRVKALGLNYKVCRNYYALWEKEHKS